MKTNVFFPRTVFFFALVGFLSVVFVSCGSFKNTSYYDRDGIYGSGNEANQQVAQPTNQAAQYSNYFSSLQDPQETTETFTNVERYSSISDSITPQYSTQYTPEYTNSQGGWGSNPTSTNFNFYNTNWGMNNYWYNSYWNNPFLFWGWDFWYSPFNMGWGFQPYMNYFGGFYPYNFYNYNPYGPNWYYGNTSYQGGRRHGMGRYATAHNYAGNRNILPRSYGNNSPRNLVRNSETGTRNYTNPRFSNSNPNLNMNGTRNYITPRSNNTASSTTSPRFNSSGNSSPKSDSTPTRSNSSSGTRNYSPSPSNSGNYNGGSYNSTSGSGGRSSGGGRR